MRNVSAFLSVTLTAVSCALAADDAVNIRFRIADLRTEWLEKKWTK